MQTPLLQTKLYIPQSRAGSSNLILRPRLMERLARGLSGKLTLISAPAGFGKTTLVSEWANQKAEGREPVPSTSSGQALSEVEGMKDESGETSHPSSFTLHPSKVAWLSLEEADNDLTRFLGYVIAALQTRYPHLGETVPAMLQSPQPPPLESLLTILINDIAAIPEDFVLVLDDYHVITVPPIQQALTFLLDHLPPQLHLALTTRADPPLPLARMRARGEMVEIREADLRFTKAETSAFLQQVMNIELSADDLTALHHRTEGWITGLHLAALSIRGSEDVREFVQTFTGGHHYILDYLLEEVFQQQSESIQVFLLQTSILERLCSSLCDAVTGRDDGQPTLEILAQANLFILPLDDEWRWFRYHHLFADLLRHRLQQTLPAQWLDLHRRAAAWYEQHSFTNEAIDHALQAEAYSEAARLVEANAFATLKHGEVMTVLGWFDRLPQETVHTHSWLSVWHAWALLLTGQVAQIEPCLAPLSTTAEQTPPPQEIQGHLCAIRAYVSALSNEPARAMELAQQALSLLPEDSRDVRSIVTFVLGGLSVMGGDVAGAATAFAEAAEMGQAAGNINLAMPAIRALGDMQVAQGRLHQAVETYQDALQLATTSSGRLMPLAAGASRGLGELMYEWNDLAAAERHLSQGLELAEQWGQLDTMVSSHVAMTRLRQVQGEFDEARDLLQKAAQMMHRHTATPTVESALAAQQMRLELVAGNPAAAARHAQERGLQTNDELIYIREAEYIELARLLMAQNKPDEAQDLLARLHHATEASGRTKQVIETLILQAMTLQMQGDIPQAMTALDNALSLAESEGYIRTFVDEGRPMAELLGRMKAEGGRRKGYISDLLAAFKEKDDFHPSSFILHPLVEPLSEREIELLSLIADGLSNQEIARKLIIAVGTVKAHTASIYGKLDVHSRTQAVARARELQLL